MFGCESPTNTTSDTVYITDTVIINNKGLVWEESDTLWLMVTKIEGSEVRIKVSDIDETDVFSRLVNHNQFAFPESKRRVYAIPLKYQEVIVRWEHEEVSFSVTASGIGKNIVLYYDSDYLNGAGNFSVLDRDSLDFTEDEINIGRKK